MIGHGVRGLKVSAVLDIWWECVLDPTAATTQNLDKPPLAFAQIH